ncbi:MAG: rhomboid family intramembrane serine protease [Peptococcaceae bacterium]|jgi:rhomboid protease GluP|nr:rhomboid family intramembrane serine protease [Peptococcaceae bacterium]
MEDTDSFKNEEAQRLERRAIPWLTYALIAVNVGMGVCLTVVSMRSGTSYDQLLLYFGAKENDRILMGEYWRFLTPVFLHINVMHLAVNSYSLFVLGSVVERIFGRFRLITVYLTAGIMGNVLSFMLSTNPGVGASGAIFGLLGTLLFFGLEQPHFFKRYFGKNILLTLVINLTYGFSVAHIDNFAHVGGLIGGFLSSGIISAWAGRRWYLNRCLYLVLTVAVLGAGLSYGFHNQQNRLLVSMNELAGYEQAEDWLHTEEKAGQILADPDVPDAYRVAVLWTLVRAEALNNQYDQAIEHANMLQALEPADGHYILGLLYFDLKQFDLAEQELLAAKKAGAKYTGLDEVLEEIERLKP